MCVGLFVLLRLGKDIIEREAKYARIFVMSSLSKVLFVFSAGKCLQSADHICKRRGGPKVCSLQGEEGLFFLILQKGLHSSTHTTDTILLSLCAFINHHHHNHRHHLTLTTVHRRNQHRPLSQPAPPPTFIYHHHSTLSLSAFIYHHHHHLILHRPPPPPEE
ncbi:hypothetical protein HanIR_Chr03g0137181 [Helianthus annuus]|nr:hypothetical protein HanIR_Chr03g0137181 [Helianthus annuus]